MKTPVWLKPTIWGVIGGAAAMAIVGFSQLGWKTAGSAEQMAQLRADTAVTLALVPFCVAKAQQDPDQAKLAKVQAETSLYTRSDFVMKSGWATVDGGKLPSDSLARACSDKLHAMKVG